MNVQVTNVRGKKSAEDRAKICYVGRGFAGWPNTPYGNHRRLECPDEFRSSLIELPAETLDGLLANLWALCEHGAKPLGCWCLYWDGTGETPACHAAVWAELLNRRFANAG